MRTTFAFSRYVLAYPACTPTRPDPVYWGRQRELLRVLLGKSDDPAPDYGRLEAVDGRRSHGPPRVRGGGEGRAALAPVSPEPEETAWSEPDDPGAADGCECAGGRPLGGGKLDADRPEPGDPGGFAEGEEARGEGGARSAGQGDRVTGLALSKTSDEEARPRCGAPSAW